MGKPLEKAVEELKLAKEKKRVDKLKCLLLEKEYVLRTLEELNKKIEKAETEEITFQQGERIDYSF